MSRVLLYVALESKYGKFLFIGTRLNVLGMPCSSNEGKRAQENGKIQAIVAYAFYQIVPRGYKCLSSLLPCMSKSARLLFMSKFQQISLQYRCTGLLHGLKLTRATGSGTGNSNISKVTYQDDLLRCSDCTLNFWS